MKGITTQYCQEVTRTGGGEHLKLSVKLQVASGPESAHGRPIVMVLDCYQALHLATTLLNALPFHYLELDENFESLRRIVDRVKELRGTEAKVGILFRCLNCGKLVLVDSRETALPRGNEQCSHEFEEVVVDYSKNEGSQLVPRTQAESGTTTTALNGD